MKQSNRSGQELIADAFTGVSGRAALMPYMMAGYPDQATSIELGRAYLAAGADLIELGVPFSDPLADGPVIQAAGQTALAQGATVDSALAVAGELADSIPVVLMCYINLILARGQEQFVERLSDVGVAGLLVPDLPFDQADDLLKICDSRGVALIPLVAPTTTEQRLELLSSRARGFIYAVSVTGVTGERSQLSQDLAAMVERVRRFTDLPVAIGFGISSAEQAAEIAKFADGIVIGSRLIREFEQGPAAIERVSRFLSEAKHQLV